MATNFPTGLDSPINPLATDTMVAVSHSSQHANENDAIKAIEAKVGIDNSAVTTSLDYKLKNTASVSPGHKHNATDLADGSVSNAEFQYLDGVTSAIQTQINAKGPGTVTSVTSANARATVATTTTTPVITIVSAPIADTVTTNANLTGKITSVGNATSLGSFTVAEINTAISDGDIATGGGSATGTNTGDQSIFPIIAVSGQSDVVADTTNDTLTLAAGTNMTITTNAATDTITFNATSSGTGDVVGPVSATDNAIARYDLTTGKLLQNSGATLDDNALIFANGVNDSMTIHSTASTDYTFLSSSIPVLVCTQSSGTTVNVVVPNTGLVVGQKYFIFNQSSVVISVKTSGANLFRNLAFGEGLECRCITPGSAVMSSGWVTAMLPSSGFIVPTGTNTGDQNSIVGITGTKAQFNTAVTDGDVMFLDSADTVTGVKTFSTAPVINALPTGTAVASVATASTLVTRDANANASADSFIQGYTTTATAGGTTTLTVNSTYLQFFTGTLTQTLVLPITSTLVLGQQYYIRNNSTGLVIIQSSGANTIRILGPGTRCLVTCILTSGTTGASWSAMYIGLNITDEKVLSASNSLTLAGTDATTMTFPSTSATIARTDAANTFTGVQTFSTPIATGSVATMTATVGGGVPTPPNNTTTFLRGDGTFAAPAGGGFTWGTSISAGSGVALTMTSADLSGANAFQSSVHTASGTLTACTTTQNTYSTSRTYTLTSGSVTDNFIGTLFSRTNVTTGVGGTLLAQGPVVRITGTDTQTAGTLSPSYDCLQIVPSLRSTGSSINISVPASIVTRPTNGHVYLSIDNTQTVDQRLMHMDFGTSNAWHTGLTIGQNGGTINDANATGITTGIGVFTFTSAIQPLKNTYGYYYGKNFATNSTNNATGVEIVNEQNAGTGKNTGVKITNNSTEWTTATTLGSGIGVIQAGVDGTALSIYGNASVNSSTNGLVNYTLSNTQSGATVMQKIDLGTSAQGHTGLLINAYNASNSASGININLSTTGTGAGLRITGTGATGTIGKIHFVDSIATGAALGVGINFATWVSQSSNSGTAISIPFLGVGTGSAYGIKFGEMNRDGTSYGVYMDTLTSSGSTGTTYGWYVANLQDIAETVASTSKYFSLRNAQSAVLANRSTDASEILFSRTNTATSLTKTDAFNLSYLKRTSVQNGAGGTFSTSGSVLKLENVATQTAGTLTDNVDVLNLTQSSSVTTGKLFTGVVGSTERFKVHPMVANSGTNNAYLFDTTTALSGTTTLGIFANAGTTRVSIGHGGSIAQIGSANNRVTNNRILYGATTDSATAVELTTDGGAVSGSTNRISVPTDTTLSIVLNIGVKQSGSANAKQMLRQVVITNNAGTTALSGTPVALGTDVGDASLTTVSCTITANNTDDCLSVVVNGVAATNLRYTCMVVSTEVLYV